VNLRLVDADASLVFQNFKILRWIGFLFFRIKKFSVGRDEVVEGWYCVADGHVVLTDADGKALGTKRHLNAGDDARLIACRMVRERRRNSPTASEFSDRLIYQKLRY
jgi:hypothetical protein